jgi:ketosteroid isomerase-like protein
MDDRNFQTAQSFLARNREGAVVDSIKEHCTDDFVWWVAGYGEVQTTIGVTSKLLRSHYTGSGATFAIRGVTREGDRVAIETEASTPLKNGTVYHNRYHFLFSFRDGRIAELREYHDTAHARDVWAHLLKPA